MVAHEVSGTPEAAVASYLLQLSHVGFAALPITRVSSLGGAALAGIVRGAEQAVVHGFRRHEQTVVAVTRIGTHKLERASVASDFEESHVE